MGVEMDRLYEDRQQCQPINFKKEGEVIRAIRDRINIGQMLDDGPVEDQIYRIKVQCREHGYGKKQIAALVEKACYGTVWEQYLDRPIRGKKK
jgi:hypothetical protein